MTALIIVGAIVAVVLFLLFLEGGITLEYNGEIAVYITVLCFRFPLIPTKEKRINLADYSAKRYRKAKEKERAKEEKEAAKKAEKAAEKKAKSDTEAEKSKKTASDVATDIKDYTALALDALKVFVGHLRIDLCRCTVTVGGKDASAAAITYGIVSQAVAYLAEVVSSAPHFRRVRNAKISVNPDFLSDGIKADVKVRFRVRVIHIIHVALHGGIGYVKLKNK